MTTAMFLGNQMKWPRIFSSSFPVLKEKLTGIDSLMMTAAVSHEMWNPVTESPSFQ